jgi:uncharacterized protein involved in outer membrane biogenesis
VRFFLTIVAVSLVLILSAALVAPLFIDWSAHRAEIEQRLSAWTGSEVALAGPIRVSLLPTPYLETGPGSIAGAGEDSPRLEFEQARLELALLKLASGAVRFADIELAKPVLTVSRAADGALRLPVFPAAEAETVGFDRLAVEGGRIRIAARSAGAAREFDNVRLVADASSLAGPYHVEGQFASPSGAPVVFRLTSETAAAAGTPVRLAVDSGPSWPSLQFDGALEPIAKGKSPRISGAATIASAAADALKSWAAVGRMTADLDRATVEGADFRLGPEERALRAEGSATLTYGPPGRLTLQAKAKQANLDALLRGKNEQSAPPSRAAALIADALKPVSGGAGLALDARVSLGDVILGGQTLQSVSGSLRSTPGAPLRAAFDAGLPGRGRIRGEGDFETGAAPKFNGAVDFSCEDLALLEQWAGPGGPEFARRFAVLGDALAGRSLALSGHVEASAVAVVGRDLKIALGRSTLTGSLGFTKPVGADRGRLYVDLASDSLDLDALPTGEASAALVGDLDLSLSLTAKALHIGRVNDAEVDSGSLALKLAKTGSEITLDQLSLADLGGATLDAKGALGRDGASLSGRLRAASLGDFASLVARLAPGDWSRKLVERAEALSPTAVTFEAHGKGAVAGSAAVDSLKASGTLGQTQATLSLDPGDGGGRQLLSISLDSLDSGALLRQIGLARGSAASGRGRLTLQASGSWATGYGVEATGGLAGAEMSAHGRFLPAAESDDARLFGSARLRTQNVSPLLAALALAPQGSAAIGPVEASADLTLRDRKWTASRLSATIAGIRASGDLAYAPAPNADVAGPVTPSQVPDSLDAAVAIAESPSPPELTGELSLDRLKAAELFALALGAPQPVKSGALWSDARLAQMPLNPPAAAIGLSIGALDMNEGLAAQNVSTTLRFNRGKLDLDDIAMKIAGGAASGRLTLRRDRDSATLTGALSAQGISVARAGIALRVGGSLEFASTGRSVAALIEGLAGNGTVDFADLTLAGSDPAALDRVVAKAQGSETPLDETNVAYAIETELGKAPLAIPDGESPIALTAGTIKISPVAIARARGEATLAANFDLSHLTLETRLSLASPATGLKFWSGPPPAATVTFSDALQSRKRQLDVSALSAGLATQAIARESDRIANLEADIRERAFFNRRLKGERFLDRRATEMEAWRAEQARAKSLAEREAAEKAAEKAAAEKAAAQKAAGESAAAAGKGIPMPELPPEIPPAVIARPPAANGSPAGDRLGAVAPPPADAPTPPTRAKPRPPPADPTQGGLY